MVATIRSRVGKHNSRAVRHRPRRAHRGNGGACDFHGDHLYVFGSHFGSKDGPLEARRAWVARVAKDDLPGTSPVSGRREMPATASPFTARSTIGSASRGWPCANSGRGRANGSSSAPSSGPRRSRRRGPAGSARMISRSTSRACASSPTARCCSACATRHGGGYAILVEPSTSRPSSPTPRWRRHSVPCGPRVRGQPGRPGRDTRAAPHRRRPGPRHRRQPRRAGQGHALVADHPVARAHCEHWAMRLPEHRGGGVVDAATSTLSGRT